AELAETVYEIQLLLREVVGGAIVRDLAGDLDVQARRIELGDAPDARMSMNKIIEKASNVPARGGNNSQAGDGYSSHTDSDLCIGARLLEVAKNPYPGPRRGGVSTPAAPTP